MMFLIAAVAALIVLTTPVMTQPSNCQDFTELVSAVQAQEKAGIQFDVLDDAQVKTMVQAFGEIPFTGYERVIVMHNDVAGMVLFTKGNCIIGRSQALDYSQLVALLGIKVQD